MLLLVAVLLSFSAVACGVAPEGTVAFVNVNVLPMDGERVLEDRTVVTSGGRIVAVEAAKGFRVPRGAEVVAGEGGYLMPGLTEMHGHLPGGDAAADEVDRILFLFLSNGVTTVRGMLGDPSHLSLRDEIAAGARLGPSIYAAGPAFRGSAELTPDEARERVRAQQADGYDLLKILEGLDPAVYDAIAEEAAAAGIPFGGHVPDSVGLLHAIAAGQRSIDHLDNFLQALEADDSPLKEAEPAVRARDLGLHLDEAKLPALVAAVKLEDASVVPTMTLWETFNADLPVESYLAVDGIDYMPQQTVDRWAESQRGRRERLNAESGARVIEVRKRVLKSLRDEGARIVFGTDAPQVFNVPGFAIHREMQIMEAAGMTPFEILASATSAAAEHFRSDEFGRVAVGRRADLILLERDPLADLANLAVRLGVMVRGRWIPEDEIQARLSKLEASAGR